MNSKKRSFLFSIFFLCMMLSFSTMITEAASSSKLKTPVVTLSNVAWKEMEQNHFNTKDKHH